MAEPAQTTPQMKPAMGWAALASLLAIESLFIIEPRFMGLHLLAGLIALTALIRFRLPNNPLVTWPIRLLLLGTVFFSQSGRTLRGSPWMLDPSYVNLFGYLCAAELVAQFWIRHKSAHGEILVMSAMVFAAASATYDRQFIPMIAPAYVLLLAMSMREFRSRAGKAPTSESRKWPLATVWAIVLASTLGIGFAGATVLREYGEKITIYPLRGLFNNMNNPFEAAGLSANPRLTGSLSNQQGTKRVLRIEGSWSGGHVRAMSFDAYAEGGWSTGYARRYNPASRRELGADAPGRRVRVTRLIGQLNFAFAPLNSAGISVGIHTDASWDLDRTVQLWMADEQGSEPYEVVLGKRENDQGPLCAPVTEEDRQRFLAVPEKIQQPLKQILAKTGAAEQADPENRIAAIARYLMDNHGYSLSMKTGSGDPVVDFLVNKRDGYCQYFASALVLLSRTAGVPARFVTGYYAHERVADGVTVVRQRDAHAWAEVWIDGVGWITVDATPATGRPDQNAEQPGWWQRFKEWSEDKWAAFKEWLASLGWVRIAIGFGVAAVSLAMLKALWELIRQRRPRRRAGEIWYGDGDLGAIARLFDQLLKGSGAACSASCTWSEHLESMRRQSTRRIDLDTAAAFVRKYQEARFGAEPNEAAARELREMLQRL